MDRSDASVITAIRNNKLESLVATILSNLGWNLLFRATGSDGLAAATKSDPSALVIASDDFNYLPSSSSNPFLILDSKQAITEHELLELLRRVGESSLSISLSVAPCKSEVTLVATLDSGIGGSTFAIDAAYESARLGRKTLLLDFNSANPSLSRYFDIQRIDRSVTPTRFGFFLGEISQVATLPALVEQADDFDEVVIDIGKFPNGEHLISGVRIHETLTRWGIQSSSHLYFLARSDEDSLQRLRLLYSHALLHSVSSTPMTLLVSSANITGREKRLISEKATAILETEVRNLPRDARAIKSAVDARAPLAVQAPKSPLAHEISSLYRARAKRAKQLA